MGTKVQSKSYLPRYYPMRDLNEDSNSCSWSMYYEDKGLTGGQYYNGFLPKAVNDAYPGYDKDSVKQKMLEHEAIFKNQVHELHRLYRVQRDMMDGVQRKEPHRNRMQVEMSLSSSPLTSEDARKWTNHSFPLANSIYVGQSVSGINSPLSSMEGNGRKFSQNGCSIKEIKVLESRPYKVRRKMFDLQLPADEYIDTEEGGQMSIDRVAATSSLYPRNPTVAHENGIKFNLDDGRATGDRIGSILKSDAHLRSQNIFADLNEPIQLEDVKETNISPYNFCNGKIHESDRLVKPNSELLGLPNGVSLNSYGRNGDAQSNLDMHKNGNGSRWFSHVPDVGQRKSNLEFPHSFQRTQVSVQVSTGKAHQPTFYLSDKSKGEFRKEETVAEISGRPHNLTNADNHASIPTSHINSLPQISPPELVKPWSSSWEKPSSNFSQKPISAQTYGTLNADTLSKSSLASVQRDGMSGDNWYLRSNATSKPAFASELPCRNGFCQGSSSGSKDQPIQIPSSSVDYLCSDDQNDKAPGHWINNGSAKYCKASNCADMKSLKDMNLNVGISDSSSKQETHVHGIEILGAEENHEYHLAVLPWLRAKPACKNEVAEFEHVLKNGETNIFQSSQCQVRNTNDKANDSSQHIVRSFSSSDVLARSNEPSNCHSSKKLLGFPIFENPKASENDSSSRASRPWSSMIPSENKVVNKLNRILDINLPCNPTTSDPFDQPEEESMVSERVIEAKSASLRQYIDLNSCLSDDEACLKTSAPTSRLKIIAEIDLEAPAVAEAEENVMEEEESPLKPNEAPVKSPKRDIDVQQDELMAAVEAIMAISASIYHTHMDNSSSNPAETPQNESALADPLTWFVEIVSSCEDDIQGKLDAALRVEDNEDNGDDCTEEFDDFESMILQLTETKEEDYMPTPLVPDNLKPEEVGPTLLTSRPRKGQARRGRQRRDFQRDILPGLASLSRHEVTEDIQLFGGLMRAMGHSWHSGLARRSSARNGSGRGRRRVVVSPPPPAAASCAPLMQMLNVMETGLEDRSLTGWGKTTRRPRRQRCSAGNPTSVGLN